MYSVELYAGVRRACHVEGMSKRQAARVFGIDRKTVDKMLAHSVPPGYRRSRPPGRPKLDPLVGIIDRILEADHLSHPAPREQPTLGRRLACVIAPRAKLPPLPQEAEQILRQHDVAVLATPVIPMGPGPRG